MAPVEPRVRVGVVFSPRAGELDEVELLLNPGATVGDALAASGLQARHPEVDLSALAAGIWGALCERGDVLRDRDRVELYRPLRVDPKEARRQRQQVQRGVKR
jgi:putative ubiquitin-RnfH superfamily antitoxin RatB of RatAB toxin-antitoxin module